MKRRFGVFVVVGFVLLLPILYFVFILNNGKGSFYGEHGRLFLREHYEPQYSVADLGIKVTDANYENMVVMVEAKYETGALDIELVNPKGEVIYEDIIQEEGYQRIETFTPMKGEWTLRAHSEPEDQMRVRLLIVDEKSFPDEREWRQEDKTGVDLDTGH